MGDEDETPAQVGAVDPASIPPPDSNEQLGIAHDKREAAFAGAGSRRAEAARASGDAEKAGKAEDADDEAGKAEAARATPPQGRTSRPKQQA